MSSEKREGKCPDCRECWACGETSSSGRWDYCDQCGHQDLDLCGADPLTGQGCILESGHEGDHVVYAGDDRRGWFKLYRGEHRNHELEAEVRLEGALTVQEAAALYAYLLSYRKAASRA